MDGVATTNFGGLLLHIISQQISTTVALTLFHRMEGAALTAAPGVGPLTAQMFLIHQLRRPDVLPAGDLGIRHAVQVGWALPALPRVADVQERGRGWAPYRTYAAALLWASLHPAPTGTSTGRTTDVRRRPAAQARSAPRCTGSAPHRQEVVVPSEPLTTNGERVDAPTGTPRRPA